MSWQSSALSSIGLGHLNAGEEALEDKADMFDLMEQGVGGEALTTLTHAAKGGHAVRCSVRRVKSKDHGVSYHMYTDAGEFLLSAHTCAPVADAEKEGEKDVFVFSQFMERSEHCFATLRASHAAGKNPTFAINYRRKSFGPDGTEDLGCVTHDTVDSTPLYSMKVAVPRDGGDGSDSTHTLRTRVPRWNEDMQSYTLDYGGRALLASAKNFQLELVPGRNDAAAPSAVGSSGKGKAGRRGRRGTRARDGLVMQFGKFDDNCFNLDYSFPLCGLQAFGIALSTYTWK